MALTASHISYQKLTPSGVSCGACTNSSCLIKRNISTLENSNFVNNKSTLQIKKGQQFIIEGAPVSGLYFVKQGKVKVFRTGIHGKEHIVRFANEGEIIGHRGFGTADSYSIGAIALEHTVLCCFSKQVLQDVLFENPHFSYDMMLFYANELNKSEAKVKSLSQMTVRERVADMLLYINRKFGAVNGFLNLPLSRKEYADYTGTSEEQVIRIFSALKKEKLIIARGKKIGISDIEGLKNEISAHNFFLDS
ncbi:Crp/Fnr family transcriptional regulator [Formosa sediminum]|uniref:Crp/Fnr family transcriptional regulator n=1 Tax=Formosa sediminum TaxID=2594004 RepID=A0A516GV13_9FLAO|nr:Crp/Fnr family transcriptional regulator [Formosa sediminum]QDO95359.1 Crp/Fnr family transcriptional regulator [Formosa sediminum]